ncbi:cytidine deaminase [Streptomyces filamentosus]|uniref:Cytidine deaminase n=2 Tax=Streptomyces filamentosus TaxID=67294 RepID=A0ABY4UT20_STRFL|nr:MULTISPECIES: cytidine deaminase [Streptomyces]MYR81048.1 cytidine deaminase [Streptomyces sp. SID5466]EFE77090.1 cytidine deaminase [Streptomyces filamentosus NRRL 15998]ESU48302.1 cytidine deaminase [Streptomyces sp. HCCB10043]EWS94047.1 cytidine deaminase [Streptomyces filamentosus NRRL 11379]USC47464.1 cytidine deaminase [Streptomyces filamentosus]
MTPPPVPAFGEADWDALREAARDAMSRAYAPYSGFPVGVAARVDDGRTITGCNVENASYGLSLCAECGLVSTLQATGGGRLTHFTCVDGTGAILVPCGRCRQLLYEFGGPELLLETPDGLRTLDAMLPQSFGPQHLG